MKEKKHWNRRVLSFFLALAMVITQLGVWNAGKESVQAAENSSFTLYYYNESQEPLYVNIWSWTGISFAEDVEVTSEFGWNHDLAVMKAVDGNENWYSVTIKILDAEADDGFTIIRMEQEMTIYWYNMTVSIITKAIMRILFPERRALMQ